jgi:hypothetical protein
VYGGFDGSRGAGGWPIAGTPEYAWRVEARLVSMDVETVHMEVTWGRYRRGAAGPEIGDTRVLKLLPSERHVLDLVQAEAPSARQANLLVEIRSSMVDDPSYAAASIDYDLWFVHESAAGQKTTRRLQLAGSQGEWKRFSFRPMGFALDGALLPADATAPVAAYADGEILGRLRGDGTMGLAIKNGFGVDCQVAGNRPGRAGGRGKKELVVRENEAISLELPISGGWCTITPAPPLPPNARPGVTARDGGVRVTAAQFFGADRFSLVVTARQGK